MNNKETNKIKDQMEEEKHLNIIIGQIVIPIRKIRRKKRKVRINNNKHHKLLMIDYCIKIRINEQKNIIIFYTNNTPSLFF